MKNRLFVLFLSFLNSPYPGQKLFIPMNAKTLRRNHEIF